MLFRSKELEELIKLKKGRETITKNLQIIKEPDGIDYKLNSISKKRIQLMNEEELLEHKAYVQKRMEQEQVGDVVFKVLVDA